MQDPCHYLGILAGLGQGIEGISCAFMVIHARLRALVWGISRLGQVNSTAIRVGMFIAYQSVYRFVAVDPDDHHCKEPRHETS